MHYKYVRIHHYYLAAFSPNFWVEASCSFNSCLSYTAGKSRFGNLLSLAHSPGKQDRLYMKGPGGHGEVEVAVSGVVGMKFTCVAVGNSI